MSYYLDRIKYADSIDELDEIMDRAADDMSISNSDYDELYNLALRKAKNWIY